MLLKSCPAKPAYHQTITQEMIILITFGRNYNK